MQLRERDAANFVARDWALLQSPLASLNPALRIRTQLKKLEAHVRGPREECQPPSGKGWTRKFAFRRGIPAPLSLADERGQAQRCLIGMAVLHRPALLLATSLPAPLTRLRRKS